MEIIDFINDLRKMGGQYYDIWLPIIVRFHKEETVVIKINVPLNVPKTTYHRVIKYGLSVFPKHVTSYVLTKTYSSFILSKKEVNCQEFASKNQQPIEIAEIVPKQIQTVVELIEEKPKAQRKKSNESSYDNEVYETIIDYLNQSTGKNYKHKSTINRKFITSRLNDGFTVDDFKKVIEVKSINWLGGKMEQFLRPETLFSNKFESYLNENVISNTPNSNLKNTYDQVNLATEFFNSQE
jgi:uncharacterized phage protein (TIGR02220 family)